MGSTASVSGGGEEGGAAESQEKLDGGNEATAAVTQGPSRRAEGKEKDDEPPSHHSNKSSDEEDEDDKGDEHPPQSQRAAEAKTSALPRRRMSLEEMMPHSYHGRAGGLGSFSAKESTKFIFNPTSSQLTVGDIVKTNFSDGSEKEGIIVDKVSNYKVRVDFGEFAKEVLIDNCVLLIAIDEYELGDKVECNPAGSALFFVGKVIKIYEDKTMDILMEGDDPDDIERGVSPENTRKLMSRRALVVNRWKKAFMMVLAANFFKQIKFDETKSVTSSID